jgi:hypothetical protein
LRDSSCSFPPLLPSSRSPFALFRLQRAARSRTFSYCSSSDTRDLAAAAENFRRGSDSFGDSAEIYPSEPRQLVTHKYRRRNRITGDGEKIPARSQLQRSCFFSDSSSNTSLYLPSFIFWELCKEASGNLAVAAYARHPGPMRFFFESRISPSPSPAEAVPPRPAPAPQPPPPPGDALHSRHFPSPMFRWKQL